MGWYKIKRKVRALGLRTSSGVTIDAGGVTLTAGNISLTAGGLRQTLVSSTSTGSLTNYGISRLAKTNSSGNFTLALPSAGAEKFLVADSTKTQTVTCANLSYFMTSAGSTSGQRKATFNAKDEILHLVGASSVKWFVIANPQGVTFGTS